MLVGQWDVGNVWSHAIYTTPVPDQHHQRLLPSTIRHGLLHDQFYYRNALTRGSTDDI